MKYFTDVELACKCGTTACTAPKQVRSEFATKLDQIRKQVGRPVSVNSGNRCPYWNAKHGGTENSDHLTGEGADLSAPTSQARFELVEAALVVGITRIGIHTTFVHVGVSKALPARVLWLY
ncbi:MAG: D-Ala-D-Ala carboxypeptidase family metallohydrolase [Tepidiformaceae bacterium]